LQVLVVLVEKGGLFAQHKVVYFVIGTRVRVCDATVTDLLLAWTACEFSVQQPPLP
jgi:hypothetical protein